MPKIVIPVGELYTAIERPVAMDVVKSIIKHLAIDSDSVGISFPGKAEIQPLLDSREWQQNTENRAHFSNSTRIRMDVVEEPEDEEGLMMYIHDKNAQLYFDDPDLGIHIRPIYNTTKATISINFRAGTLKEVETWRNQLMLRLSRECREYTFDVDYLVTVPKELAGLLTILHGLRESNVGYGEELSTYLKAKMSPKMTVLSDQGNRNKALAWREQQQGILGWFDFETLPKESRESTVTYEANFDFIYTYQKPVSLSVVYPLVVHNQLIPRSVYDYAAFKDYWLETGDKSTLNQLFDEFRKTNSFVPSTSYIRIPHFDEFDINSEDFAMNGMRQFYVPLLSGLVNINPDAPRTLLKLKELGDYVISPEITEWLSQTHTELNKQYCSPWVIMVFVGDEAIAQEEFFINEDLEVTLNEDANERLVYRVGIMQLKDPLKLTEKAVESLLYSPVACSEYLFSMRSQLVSPDNGLEVIGNRKVTRKSFNEFVSLLKTSPGFHRWDNNRIRALVHNCIITTNGR